MQNIIHIELSRMMLDLSRTTIICGALANYPSVENKHLFFVNFTVLHCSFQIIAKNPAGDGEPPQTTQDESTRHRTRLSRCACQEPGSRLSSACYIREKRVTQCVTQPEVRSTSNLSNRRKLGPECASRRAVRSTSSLSISGRHSSRYA